jgi:hypothetical protein
MFNVTFPHARDSGLLRIAHNLKVATVIGGVQPTPTPIRS